MKAAAIIFRLLLVSAVQAWIASPKGSRQFYLQSSTSNLSNGRLHGQDACFLPLEQLDQQYRAPRILQVSDDANWS
jgi:hypothetical protein